MTDFVLPHDPRWKDRFAEESALIRAALGPALSALHHIGSTSIPGILAKPIIDMLGDAPALDGIEDAAPALVALGYAAMGAFGIEGRRYFRKSDAAGRRSHHLHIFASGSPHLARHLAFRDYLRAHPAVAAEYSDLKHRIMAAGPVPWEVYLDAKDPFIRKTEARALLWAARPEGDEI